METSLDKWKGQVFCFDEHVKQDEYPKQLSGRSKENGNFSEKVQAPQARGKEKITQPSLKEYAERTDYKGEALIVVIEVMDFIISR